MERNSTLSVHEVTGQLEDEISRLRGEVAALKEKLDASQTDFF